VETQSHQYNCVGSFTHLSEVTWVGQFIRFNPPNIIVSKLEDDPQGFIDEMEKIFRVLHATDPEGVDFAVYQLNDIAY